MGDADVAHARSNLEINPALDLFDVPDTDISYNGYRMVIHNPVSFWCHRRRITSI